MPFTLTRRLPRALPLLVCALTVAVALAATGARAEKADREKTIFYQGDSGGANLGSKDGELAGSVVITQGTLTIHADRIVFHQNPDNSVSATAYGNPLTFREKRDSVDEYYEGYAQRVEYDGSKELVELFDRALLKRGQDEIRSNYVSYNTATEVFKAEGRASTVPDPTGPGARVRGMFQRRSGEAVPGKSKDGAKAPAKEPAREPAKAPAGVTLQPAGDLVSPAAK
jgi:lipopolysaccharide export system protein LptA